MYSFDIKLVVDYRRGSSKVGRRREECSRGALLVSYSGRFILQYIGLGQISIITLACLSLSGQMELNVSLIGISGSNLAEILALNIVQHSGAT